MVSKKKYSSECGIEKIILGITNCHHSSSLVMPNGDTRVGFFYPTLTLLVSVSEDIGVNCLSKYLFRGSEYT